jgi:histidinol-phosphate/aromatic aminotransferase/cobyric acid decarboxylase-like protein
MQFDGALDGRTSLDGLRITVGTDDEIDKLLSALADIVPSQRAGPVN